MRLYGAVAIILSCGIMGMIVARSYVDQVRNLKNLLTMAQLLETEIHYARTSLPDAFKRISQQLTGPTAQFLYSTAQCLEDNGGTSITEAWTQKMEVLMKNGLPSDVAEDLVTFGNSLGISDVEDQQKHLHLLRVRLTQALERAEEEKRTNLKLWNYLGFGTGFLITLLLY